MTILLRPQFSIKLLIPQHAVRIWCTRRLLNSYSPTHITSRLLWISANASAPTQSNFKPMENTIVQGGPTPKVFNFAQAKQELENNNSRAVFVDVREPNELAELGRIPGAINLPFKSAPDSFEISPEVFKSRFGYSRPDKDAHLVFYCKSGVRAHSAADKAREAGYKNVTEYPGSFSDWQANRGPVERNL